VRLQELPTEVRARLRPVITRLTHQLLAQVKAGVPVRTGKLRQRVHSFIDDEHSQRRNFIRGRVRVLNSYSKNFAAAAGALEYGRHRRFEVRAHRVRRTEAFGRPTKPYTVNMPAHTRRANIVAMRFLRGPAAAQLPRARAEIRAVIEQAVRELGLN
jgi:hypothetical protein